ncbi:hypothetical protein MUO14_00955 [Halobacillus shinanisalinarum]|uniref:Uncharacterized protein n=1 Tax=Halobacillus shinanisalinarum TaxID=2932258 RepID=A0ABY4GZI4_9BACI|nr:hypothetical protein [Halobacillus shinanisalinarum]UOQ93611.1 hypothetical protein MUO14_00955 [Halobacillus shinanisalinarum]
MTQEDNQKDQAFGTRNVDHQKLPEEKEVNVLRLPPRNELHKKEQAQNNWKLSKIWLRFLVLVFILIIFVFLSSQYWNLWFGETHDLDRTDVPYYHEEITIERKDLSS